MEQGFLPDMIGRVITFDEDDHRMSEFSEQGRNNEFEPELFVPHDDYDDDDDNNNEEPTDHDVLEPEQFVPHDDNEEHGDDNGEPMDHDVLEPEQLAPQDDEEEHGDNNAEPTDGDVRYGQGPNTYKLPGNTWYRDEHLPQYLLRYSLSTTNAGKRRVAQEALDALTGARRRMLKSNGSGGWTVPSSEENLTKIMCDIRHSTRSQAQANGPPGVAQV
jgi:hypothetical protein